MLQDHTHGISAIRAERGSFKPEYPLIETISKNKQREGSKYFLFRRNYSNLSFHKLNLSVFAIPCKCCSKVGFRALKYCLSPWSNNSFCCDLAVTLIYFWNRWQVWLWLFQLKDRLLFDQFSFAIFNVTKSFKTHGLGDKKEEHLDLKPPLVWETSTCCLNYISFTKMFLLIMFLHFQ